MENTPESDKNAAFGTGLVLATSELTALPVVGWLSDEPHRDWQNRIGQLEHQKAKIKAGLQGSFQNLAVVETGQVNQKIIALKDHEPGQFGGPEVAGAVGGVIVVSGVLTAIVIYGARKAIRKVKDLPPMAA